MMSSNDGCARKAKLKTYLGPSILNGDLSCLKDECVDLMEKGSDYLHLDVMDGFFVNNLTFGHPVVKCLRTHIKDTFFDMHMMVLNPEKWVKPVAEAGGTQYTFHIEATQTPEECIRLIKENGMKVGLGVNPKTPVETIVPLVNDIDTALIMTVEPGRGGQAFMGDMLSKVKFLREKFPLLDISVDGGVGPTNIDTCLEHGANIFVSGSAITASKDRKQVIEGMKKKMHEYYYK